MSFWIHRLDTDLVKIGPWEIGERSSKKTSPSPHFAQNGPIAPKSPRNLSPLDLSTYTEFGPDRLRFAELSGFQPTI